MDTLTLLDLYQSGRRDFAASYLRDVRIAGADLSESNFSGCDFTGAVLGGANFNRCNLTEATFTECNGIGASFIEADFTRTRIPGRVAFRRADFFRARFIETIMTGNFDEAFFVEARFSSAFVTGCHFEQAVFGYNQFTKTILTSSEFLDVRIAAPCQVDDDTVRLTVHFAQQLLTRILSMPEADRQPALDQQRRSNRSVERFLRAVGVDDAMLEANFAGMDLVADTEESVFISYSSADERFANELRKHLYASGIRTWFAPQDIQGGTQILAQLADAIRKHSTLVVVLSEASIMSSWVAIEVRLALDIERQSGRRVFFPIRLCEYQTIQDWRAIDQSSGEDLAEEVRNYVIPDFSGWQVGLTLGEATARLINDLRHR